MYTKQIQRKFREALAQRLDADQVVHVFPALDDTIKEALEAPLPVLQSRGLVPIRPGQPGKSRWKAQQLTKTGAAKFMSHGSGAKDFPRVDFYKEEIAFPYRTLGVACSYNIDELEAAAADSDSESVDSVRMIAARDACLRLMDETLMSGDADLGMEGFANHSSAPTVVTLPNGTWLADGRTAAEIAEDWNYMIRKMLTDSKGLFQVSKVAMPLSIHGFLQNKAVDQTNQTTLLRQFAINNPEIQIVPSWRLDLLNAGGTGPRMVLYVDSPAVVQARISVEPTPTPPQPDALQFDVYWRAKMSGVGLLQPLGMMYTDFVAS